MRSSWKQEDRLCSLVRPSVPCQKVWQWHSSHQIDYNNLMMTIIGGPLMSFMWNCLQCLGMLSGLKFLGEIIRFLWRQFLVPHPLNVYSNHGDEDIEKIHQHQMISPTSYKADRKNRNNLLFHLIKSKIIQARIWIVQWQICSERLHIHCGRCKRSYNMSNWILEGVCSLLFFD